MRRSIFGFIVCIIALAVNAQVPVILAPLPQFHSILSNGSPNALGCVFTYFSGTTTPLGTYTDSTGTTLNANPVILSSSGSANIWIQAGIAYSFTVKSFGGVNCATGSTIYSVRGIAGGTSSAVTVVPFSATPSFNVTAQDQLFQITLTGNAAALPLNFTGVSAPVLVTFQITEDNVGGHTWAWPPNVIGGAPILTTANQTTTQHFIWNGTSTVALGPAVTGNGPALSADALTLTGALTGNTIFANTYTGGNMTLTGLDTNQGTATILPNNNATGTVLNELAAVVNGTAQLAGIGPQTNLLGIVIAGAGTTGSATIQRSGVVSCVFDGPTVNGADVVPSSTNAGQCHAISGLAGNEPAFAGLILGIISETHGGGGTYPFNMFNRGSNSIVVMGSNGNNINFQKAVLFSGALVAGTKVITFTGNAVYAVNGNLCWGTDLTANNPIQFINNATNQVTVTGTGTDSFLGMCIGNF